MNTSAVFKDDARVLHPSQKLTRNEEKVDSNLAALQDVFLDNSDDESKTRFGRSLVNSMRRYSLDRHFHSLLAICANFALTLTASPFKLLPEWLFFVFAILSVVVFYLHFVGRQSKKNYQIYDFKNLFFKQKFIYASAKYTLMQKERP